MGPVVETFDSPLSRKRRIIRNLAMIGGCVLVVGILAWKLCWVTPPDAYPTLRMDWDDQVYSLDDDEVVRLIVPPFIPHGVHRASNGNGGPRPRVDYWKVYTGAGSVLSQQEGTMDSAAGFVLRRLDRGFYINVENASVPGDWSVRFEVPAKRRLEALRSILKQLTGKELRFEKREVERDVIVVKGRWKYKPPESWTPDQLPFIQLYARDDDLKNQGPQSGTCDFDSFLYELGRWKGWEFVDETEGPKPEKVQWADFGWPKLPLKDSAAFEQFLRNLKAQTSLEFEVASRPTSIWFIEERVPEHAPGDAE